MSAQGRVRRHAERGMALGVWMAVGLTFFVLVLGIAVDFAGKIALQQDAAAVAGEAARAGGQAVDFNQAGQPVANPGSAQLAARAYLRGSEYTGSVTATGSTVTVTVHATYKTVFLSAIGINTLPVTATATAEAVRSIGGAPR